MAMCSPLTKSAKRILLAVLIILSENCTLPDEVAQSAGTYVHALQKSCGAPLATLRAAVCANEKYASYAFE